MELKTAGIIIAILFIHWIGDFVLQNISPWIVKNKSKNFNALLAHTGLYSICWFTLLFFGMPLITVLQFILITFFIHTIQDYWTSKLNGRLTPKRESWEMYTSLHGKAPAIWHHFPEGENLAPLFISIGFDQFLHFTQLILTYYYLSNGI